jgi:tetratricopeptide (TPR) repeat protein
MAYFIGNLSLFDNLLSLMAFMIVIGFIKNASSNQRLPKPLSVSPQTTITLSIFIVIATFFTLKFTCLQAYKTNKEIVKAYGAGSLDEVIETYEQAYSKAIIGKQEIAEQLANIAKDVANNPVPEPTKQHYFQVARNMMASEIKQHPNYARLQIIYGNLLEAQGDKVEIIKTFEKVQILAPKRQSSLIQLAMAYARNKDYDKAQKLLERTFLLEKNNEEPKVYQSVVLAMKGDREKRNFIINQLTDNGLNKNIELIKNAYAITNDLNDFLVMCNKRFMGNINTSPNTYKIWAITAFNLKNNEQTATAVYAFRRHFAEEENFKDSREAHLVSQDVAKGIDPSFVFEKLE